MLTFAHWIKENETNEHNKYSKTYLHFADAGT